MASRHIREKALTLLRSLPRVGLNNLRDNPGARKPNQRGRGQHGGDTHGHGLKYRMNPMRLGYETGNNPFYLRFPSERYYKGHHLKRQYPPLSLLQLQTMIDKDRIDITKPIDLAAIVRTGTYNFDVNDMHFGVHLTDEGADIFSAKVNIEVQWAKEPVIAAIERCGGVITTAYYDSISLAALKDPLRFFKTGRAIPRRMLPPADILEFYASPENRGYLADPEKISFERLKLAQKYGYELPTLTDDILNMLKELKDPRQIFYGLAPGYVINLKDKIILKPQDHTLVEYYSKK